MLWTTRTQPAIVDVEALSMPPPPAAVTRVGNHVYLYCEINQQSAQELIKAVREADAQLASQNRELWLANTYLPIWLHINSEGGELPSSLAAADMLSMIKTPVYTVVEGLAASGATLISMVGRVRYITPNSLMLIHQLSTAFWGTHEQFKDNMQMQELYMRLVRNFYASHSKVTPELVKDLLTHDAWFNADEALSHGLVDAILRPGDF